MKHWITKINIISHEEKLILLLSFIFSLSADFWSLQSGKIVAYNDTQAHLNIARRIFDSLTPGFVQIGSVWLPLLHLLELPFTLNTFLWQSGLAGTIVSNVSFIAASFFLFKLIFLVTAKKSAAIIGSLAFILNSNLLFLQTTAMFEPLLIMTLLASVYYLTKWAKSLSLLDLIIASFFTFLSTLTRYDGWVFCLFASLFVFLVGWKIKKKGREGPFLLFSTLSYFGIFLWLLYNKLIFSDWLYFMRSEFSAFSQQTQLLLKGYLYTKNNFFTSFSVYAATAAVNIGVLATCLALLGAVYYLWKNSTSRIFLVPLLLLTPFLFNILSLFLGQSVIWLPFLPPFFNTYFNARYGILMLPAAAFFIGVFASIPKVTPLLTVLILTQFLLFTNKLKLPVHFLSSGTITLQDSTSETEPDTVSAGHFLKNNYDGGLILVSSASSDSFIFRSSLALKNFITEGNGKYWLTSLSDPTVYARYIVYFKDKSDRIGKIFGESQILMKNYSLLYQNDTYLIWKKRDQLESDF